MTKIKERLLICYKCKTKSPKCELIKVDTNKKTKDGNATYRFYHSECLTVETVNREKQDKRTSFYDKESDIHRDVKNKLFNLIINNKIKIYDQFESEIIIPKGSFVSTETPVTKEYENNIPYVSSCNVCLDSFNLDKNNTSIEKRINPKKVKSCYNSFEIHPCNKCIFNKLSYNSVFDIGIGNDKEYTAAIEILNTSRVKDYKLKYCIKNNIELFEVNANNIKNKLNYNIKLDRLWWKDENGKLKIHNDYC